MGDLDHKTYLIAVVLSFAVTMIATYLPARRVLRLKLIPAQSHK